MIVPASCWVRALNALQNSMMLTPCCPSAGPTGGAGLAAPAGIWSLISVRTFLAMSDGRAYREEFATPGRAGGGRRAPRRAGSDLLDLVVADLHRRLAAEDRNQDLEALGV